jgi:hypothetical protein
MGGVGLEGKIAQFVDDQQLRSRQECQLFVERAVAVGLGQHRHQGSCRDELNVVILTDRLAAEAHGQMGLSRSRRPEEQNRIAVGDPAASCQFPDLTWIQRWLRLEVEAVQFTHERELCQLA